MTPTNVVLMQYYMIPTTAVLHDIRNYMTSVPTTPVLHDTY